MLRRPPLLAVLLAVLALVPPGAPLGAPPAALAGGQGVARVGAQAQIRLETFPRDRLTIETAPGALHRFEVEVARTSGQHAQGLMYRRRLPESAGMLFLYGREWPVSMWMKDTLIPLDMLFIAGDGRIVHVAERTVPGSLESISAGRPVAAVLEVNGGTAARLGIQTGDRVLHPAFGNGT